MRGKNHGGNVNGFKMLVIISCFQCFVCIIVNKSRQKSLIGSGGINSILSRIVKW